MNDIRFYDTCSLLLAGEGLFERGDKFIISSVTFQELENIKTAFNKDAEIKYSARLLLHLFEQHPDMYEVIIHTTDKESVITEKGFNVTNDTMILSDAIWCDNHKYVDSTIFVTNDLALKHIANFHFGDGMIESVPEEQDTYTGYKEICVDDNKLSEFYQNEFTNIFGLNVGEYLILRDKDNNIIDVRAWDGEGYRYLSANKGFCSKWFGVVKPINNDIYQKLLFDSFLNNKITLVKGPAGTGKTYLSLSYLMYLMDKGKIDKIIIFCNTVATANSAKLGFYPGTRDEKLLDSQIGNLLSSKFGGREGVQQLMEQDKLVLLPMSDIRGYDTSKMNAGIYISEAQNLDRTLMKLALQRIGEDCVCIIDGDEKTQVDDVHFAGNNNGMKRVSKVYRGQDIYGEVQLKTIYRSKIARIAEYI